jgi:hypothetical protein
MGDYHDEWMGDPFRVDVPLVVLSAGRSDLRLLSVDAFSVLVTRLRIIIFHHYYHLVDFFKWTQCSKAEQTCQDGEGFVLRKILTKRPFNPSIIQKFCARKLLVGNFRVLRGFAKWLLFSWLDWIWRKTGIAGFKKSTPKKNLALPFYFLACLQNRKRAPNRG